MDSSNHWNQIYSSEPAQKLGWYEEKPVPSLSLVENCQLGIEDPILDVGAGASTFMDCLIEKGYRNLYAADISEISLGMLKSRLGEEKASRVTWIVDDVIKPTQLSQLSGIALWHDRALLHFLTEEEQRQTYKKTLISALRPGGYVILAAFSMQGAKQCSGLNVHNYDQESLAKFLGEGFKLKESFDYLYTMPSGNLRPYIYTLFQILSQSRPT